MIRSLLMFSVIVRDGTVGVDTGGGAGLDLCHGGVGCGAETSEESAGRHEGCETQVGILG